MMLSQQNDYYYFAHFFVTMRCGLFGGRTAHAANWCRCKRGVHLFNDAVNSLFATKINPTKTSPSNSNKRKYYFEVILSHENGDSQLAAISRLVTSSSVTVFQNAAGFRCATANDRLGSDNRTFQAKNIIRALDIWDLWIWLGGLFAYSEPVFFLLDWVSDVKPQRCLEIALATLRRSAVLSVAKVCPLFEIECVMHCSLVLTR